MPASTRKKNLPSVQNVEKFEKISKNKVSLGEDEELSADYKPMMVGSSFLPIEYSKDSIRINGDLEFDGTLISHQIKGDYKYLEYITGVNGYHRWRAQLGHIDATMDLWVLQGLNYWITLNETKYYGPLLGYFEWYGYNPNADPVVSNLHMKLVTPGTYTQLELYSGDTAGAKSIFKQNNNGELELFVYGDGADIGQFIFRPEGEIKFEGSTAWFDAQTATGDGTTTIDWRDGNKFNYTFGATNETITFGTNPSGPCNLLLKLKQDGTGSRTVTWAVTSGTLYWPGNTAPTLTTTASYVDIISFYFDGTNYYGISSLNFSA